MNQRLTKGLSIPSEEIILKRKDGELLNIFASHVIVTNRYNEKEMYSIDVDLTSIKNTERQLVLAKEQAEKANKVKSEFLANMSHEIRTPLNAVIGFTELLKSTELDEHQKVYVNNSNSSAISLLNILNDILDLSKIEAGKLELELIKTDIYELIDNVTDTLKYEATNKGIEFLLNIQNDLPQYVYIDPIRLKQIFINLLNNAIKFTEKGEIEFKIIFEKINDKTGTFTFSIRDTGIGISEEDQKKLFKAFTQADTSTTRKFGGTGLGLIISDLIAKRMKSKIKLISEEGNGSYFYFTINAEYETGKKNIEKKSTNINNILIIVQNQQNRKILEHTIKNWNINFLSADNGFSGLKLIKEKNDFDAVIIDYNLPTLNGFETVELIRNKLNLSNNHLPVILLYRNTEIKRLNEKCEKLEILHKLSKPVKKNELFECLNKLKI